jgi:hypothetical protein
MLDDNEIRQGNVSGGMDVSKRPGFGPALERLVDGAAQISVAADLSRLFRDIDQQRQTITRLDNAGGQFWTVANRRIMLRTIQGVVCPACAWTSYVPFVMVRKNVSSVCAGHQAAFA